MTHKPRAASAYAVGPSRCAGLLLTYLLIYTVECHFALYVNKEATLSLPSDRF